MLVMKFGGTSLGDRKRIENVANLIERYRSDKPLVVVSAHSKVTDMLIAAARESQKGNVDGPMEAIRNRHAEIISSLELDPGMLDDMFEELGLILKGISLIRELTPRTMDIVQSFGERASSRVLAAFMRKRGVADCRQYDAWDIGMRTDSTYMAARPLPDTYESIGMGVGRHPGELIITTGFIGKDSEGNITTLGRGGSDYTAAIFGAALGAKEIQIWTDVDGVMTADPRLVPDAISIERLSFDEASELAYFGGKVLHPSTMKPAVEKDIPIRVLNTFRPDHPGTVITKTPVRQKQTVKSVAAKRDVTMVNVVSTRMLGTPGFMAQLFSVFSSYGIVIDLISTSEVSVSLTVPSDNNLDAAIAALKKTDYRPAVSVERDKAIVSVVGHGMRHTKGLAGRVFSKLGGSGVNIQMISQGSSEINISMVVDNSDVPEAVCSLHDEFFGKNDAAVSGAMAT